MNSVPTQDLSFWDERLKKAAELGRPVLEAMGQGFDWEKVDAKHKPWIMDFVKPSDRVLDVGCGPGRISDWFEDYVGIDFVPGFIEEAKRLHPNKDFRLINFVTEPLPFPAESFDWAILVSVETNVRAVLGAGEWDEVLLKIRNMVRKGILILEYGGPDAEQARMRTVMV